MEEYNWDLTKIFKSDKEYKDTIAKVKDLENKILKYKNHIMDNSDSLYDVLSLEKELDLLLEHLYVYSHLGYYSDMSSKEFSFKKEEVLSLADEVSASTSFIDPELLKNDFNKILEYINSNSKLKPYELLLKRIFRYKDYTLSEKEEKLLSQAGEVMRVPEETYGILDNVDIKFDKIRNEEGKFVELTQSNYSTFLSSKDKNVRKNAFKKMYKYYKEHINTINSLYMGNIKNESFISKVRGYKSTLFMNLYPDEISEDLYNNLIKTTNDNINYLKDYYKYKEKSLGYKLHMYDLYVNTSKKVDKKISYKEAVDIANVALKPLGEEYLRHFNELINSKCVDVYPRKNKRSGAYEWGTYGVSPYVSLNHEDTIDSLSTLVHEMGHAMHTYYSNSNQDYLYAGYPIFLAEIASTVNEVLLSNYLVNNTNDKDEKIYYLVEFLDKFKATVYRQVMFSEFESTIHKMYENKKELNVDIINDIYLNLNKKQFGGVVIVDDDIKYEWARIPHFYTSFYVYKYATGFISALLIADKLLNDSSFKDKYIEFLSSGHIDSPLNLLKKLDIDLENEKTLKKAFDIFNEKLNELKSLEKGE